MTAHAVGGLAGSCRTLRYYFVAAILNAWRHTKNPTLVYQCVFTWRTILPNFTPIWFETTEPLGFFEKTYPKKNKKNKTSSDMGSVPDPKIEKWFFHKQQTAKSRKSTRLKKNKNKLSFLSIWPGSRVNTSSLVELYRLWNINIYISWIFKYHIYFIIYISCIFINRLLLFQ